MINLTVNVSDLRSVMALFDTIEIRRFSGSGSPGPPIDEANYTTVSGTDQINSRTGVSDILLNSGYSSYYFLDPDGVDSDWYISRFFNSSNSSVSAWSDPIQGASGDIFHNPLYPPEVSYGTAEKLTLNRIRMLIGDPIGLSRDFGPGAADNLHAGNKVYELRDFGWPASVNMYNVQYTSINDPVVNGYRYLKFQNAITPTPVTVSGVEYSIDIWYYTFRHSDRQIMEAYNNCPPPTPLSDEQVTTEIYILQTAYDLLYGETWEDMTEDGAFIQDDRDIYDPAPGLKGRKELLDELKKRIDTAVKSVCLLGIGGVLID